MSKVKNEIGNKYGLLTVLNRNGSKNGKAAWLCQCECGNYITVTGDSLRRGNTVTCGDIYHKIQRMKKVGHSNAIDITNQKFGKLTAIKPIGTAEYGGVLWECKCECGNTHIVEYSNLIHGNVKSCGCLVSYGEYFIQTLLTQQSINYKTQYTPLDWILSSGYKPFYDFAIFKDNKLVALLEYNGEQHKKFYTSKNTWNNEKNFLKTQQRDKEKQDLCNQNKIPLYVIWYNENVKKSLFKILKELKFELNEDFLYNNNIK